MHEMSVGRIERVGRQDARILGVGMHQFMMKIFAGILVKSIDQI
jgi:hypothetical protein